MVGLGLIVVVVEIELVVEVRPLIGTNTGKTLEPLVEVVSVVEVGLLIAVEGTFKA
jgi:hypothetical protein